MVGIVIVYNQWTVSEESGLRDHNYSDYCHDLLSFDCFQCVVFVFSAGCYISKLSYVRAGEKSLDSYYRPFHMVEYYRYVRFFPDGKSSLYEEGIVRTVFESTSLAECLSGT